MLKKMACIGALFVSFTAYGGDLGSAVQKDYDQHLAGLFDHFHRNPELSTVEHETAKPACTRAGHRQSV